MNRNDTSTDEQAALDAMAIRERGGIELIEETPNRALGPHKPPHIAFKNCGRENHYDLALSEDGAPGVCPNCSSFLRQPTESEHEQFTDFYAWNSKHVNAGTEQGDRDD